PPAPHVVAQSVDACTGASCACGTYHALLTSLENPATDAFYYDLYDGATRVETNAPFLISTDCAQPGDLAYPSPQPSVALAAGVHHLIWRGYDLAGNEAIGAQADLDLECPAITPPG